MPRPRPLVVGHRGAPGYRPEHSRSSYDLALAMGVDAVEPDIVVSRDGVLVVRHENEIGSTTDVSTRREFADRRTTKTVDGAELTGWFTEDFTWDELATLRCRERLPKIRAGSATFDDQQPVLRLRDVLDLVRAGSLDQGREIGVVLEIKHATYFEGLGWDVAALVDAELRDAGWARGELPLIVESFESTVLRRLQARGIRGTYIYLLEAAGRPFDLLAAQGKAALTYKQTAAPAGLDALAGVVDGISVDKRMILAPDRLGRMTGPTSVVADAHARGLQVFTWTCRPENAFLVGQFRSRGDSAAFGDWEAEWSVIRDAGVDGVFVDHADLGVGFFRR
ncbi:glycerophosphodiester phosphodiesterase family protein [Microbacterium sp. SS28]|uniref:glycerophosphodiester phosphodiesterase family protein n=1 Tax=Microbacterium sp. SS28 TaxID=2919948 RepID=UPI001FAAA4A1|nr:glycerophosphodiester phosphodiesterase family protein [Microbacterium sp. SS28]